MSKEKVKEKHLSTLVLIAITTKEQDQQLGLLPPVGYYYFYCIFVMAKGKESVLQMIERSMQQYLIGLQNLHIDKLTHFKLKRYKHTCSPLKSSTKLQPNRPEIQVQSPSAIISAKSI